MRQTNQNARKAAILIASLDAATAERLLRQMEPAQAALVRQAVEELEDIAPAEQAEIIREFNGARPAPERSGYGGVELAGSLAGGSAEQASPAPQTAPDGTPLPFRFLSDAPAEDLGARLDLEHPQTAAVVISHLPPKRAAEVLRRLRSHTRSDVLRRLSDLDETPREIVREIEQSLELWMSQQLGARRRKEAGRATLNAILEAADEESKRVLLHNLGLDDPQPAAEQAPDKQQPAHVEAKVEAPLLVTKSPSPKNQATRLIEATGHDALPGWTFLDLMRLDDAALDLVFRSAPPDVLRLALTGAEPAFIDRLTRGLRGGERRRLRKSLSQIGPVRLSDIERAQQEVARLAERLAIEHSVAAGRRTMRAAA